MNILAAFQTFDALERAGDRRGTSVVVCRRLTVVSGVSFGRMASSSAAASAPPSSAPNRSSQLRESRSRSLNFGSSVTFPSDLQPHNGGVAGGDRNGGRSDDHRRNDSVASLFMDPSSSVAMFGGWIGTDRRRLLAVAAGVLAVGVVQMTAPGGVGLVVQRLCVCLVSMFSIACLFYLLTIYLRNTWTNTSIYVLFVACFAGDLVLGRLLRCASPSSSTADQAHGPESRAEYVTGPALTAGVLMFVGVASMFSSLETSHSALVIVVVSFIRFLAGMMLTDLPEGVRPLLAYISGVVGVFGARYTEMTFLSVANSPSTESVTNLMSHGKAEIIKRRRSSASVPNSFTSHLIGRRTSLPLLMQKSVVSGLADRFGMGILSP